MLIKMQYNFAHYDIDAITPPDYFDQAAHLQNLHKIQGGLVRTPLEGRMGA
jgi:hypothetical protein